MICVEKGPELLNLFVCTLPAVFLYPRLLKWVLNSVFKEFDILVDAVTFFQTLLVGSQYSLY